MDFDKLITKKFIITFIVTFIILYIFCSFISFLGQWPVLIIITFCITYYLNRNSPLEIS